MSLEIVIENNTVYTVTEFYYDKIEFSGKVFDCLEGMKIDFYTACQILDGLLEAIETYKEQVLNSGKSVKIEFWLDEEYKKEHIENLGEVAIYESDLTEEELKAANIKGE